MFGNSAWSVSRKPRARSSVEAEFGTGGDPEIRRILEENDLGDGDGSIIIRRVVHRSGRSRSFVDDCPVVKDLAGQKARYHRNISIVGNVFETFDVPLLFALSAEDVTWRNNRVKRHDRYRGWGRKPFEVKGGRNVVVDGRIMQGNE